MTRSVVHTTISSVLENPRPAAARFVGIDFSGETEWLMVQWIAVDMPVELEQVVASKLPVLDCHVDARIAIQLETSPHGR